MGGAASNADAAAKDAFGDVPATAGRGGSITATGGVTTATGGVTTATAGTTTATGGKTTATGGGAGGGAGGTPATGGATQTDPAHRPRRGTIRWKTSIAAWLP